MLVAAAVYACCGVVRLARFNLQKEQRVYYGLPIPAAGLAVAAAALFAPEYLAGVLIVVAGLMIAGFRLEKIG